MGDVFNCQPTGLRGGFGMGCIKIPDQIKIPEQIKIPDSDLSKSFKGIVDSLNNLLSGFNFLNKSEYQPSQQPVNGKSGTGRAE